MIFRPRCRSFAPKPRVNLIRFAGGFNPLPRNNKYRGQVADCLSVFYGHLYGAFADYSRSFTRDQVLEIFEQAIALSPVLEADESEEFSADPRSQREQANWILNLLVEHGWLERHIDVATLQATYAFSRQGRLFT